ncbi:MAG: histidine phosphatase family protein [Pseudomonadota bacterium]
MPQGTGRRRIYLMRHGHVDYFDPKLSHPTEAKLTEEGREQAAAAAEALCRIDFDAALCSGLSRTVETAQIVLAEQASPPELIENLQLEELKSGWLQAKSREELAARLAYSFDGAEAEDARFLPDGERFADAEARIVAGLTGFITTGSWRTGLVVAHEGVNRIALGWACGGGLRTIAAFEQDLACINVIDIDVTPQSSGEGLSIERVLIKAINVTPYDFVKHGLSRTSLEHLFGVDFDGAPPRPALA